MKIQMRAATGLLILGAALLGCSGAAAAPTAAGPGQTSGSAATSGPGQASQPAQQGPAVDACKLLTEQEATAFLGSDPGTPVSTGSTGAPACAYGSMGVSVDTTDGPATYATLSAALQGSTNGHTIAGLGDQAVATVVGNTVADLEILKGSTLVSIVVQGDPSLQNITLVRLTALGTLVVGRL